MKLMAYGQMAEMHWSKHCPKMVAELTASGALPAMLLDAQQQTEEEMDALRRRLIQQGRTPQQAHDQAWELVREKYILIPPEES